MGEKMSAKKDFKKDMKELYQPSAKEVVSLDVPEGRLDVIFKHDFQFIIEQISCHIGMLERKLEKEKKNEILLSEIGYGMFISEQIQRFVTDFLFPWG